MTEGRGPLRQYAAGIGTALDESRYHARYSCKVGYPAVGPDFTANSAHIAFQLGPCAGNGAPGPHAAVLA